MADQTRTVRVYCNNDACEFKDMRVEQTHTMVRCPECGESMQYFRPTRQTRTY